LIEHAGLLQNKVHQVNWADCDDEKVVEEAEAAVAHETAEREMI